MILSSLSNSNQKILYAESTLTSSCLFTFNGEYLSASFFGAALLAGFFILNGNREACTKIFADDLVRQISEGDLSNRVTALFGATVSFKAIEEVYKMVHVSVISASDCALRKECLTSGGKEHAIKHIEQMKKNSNRMFTLLDSMAAEANLSKLRW